MSMPLIEEIHVLKGKLNLIDRPDWGPLHRPSSPAVIEASFWARSILEIVSSVDLKQLGHPVETCIRTVHGVEDPDHPRSAKAVYDDDKPIPLMQLLGYIVHYRYFSFAVHADGNHCLDVMSDRHVRTHVYFSDFVKALRSLALPQKFAAVAICELTEQATQKMLTETCRYEVGIFSSVNFGWVLWDFVKDHAALKNQIFSEIFHFDQVPDHALDDIRFFVSRTGPGNQMVIGFAPPWEDDQNVFSPSFNRALLYDMIKNLQAPADTLVGDRKAGPCLS